MNKAHQRPRAWKYKDPFDHERHLPYLRSRSQCAYRGEEFELSFEDWCELWPTPELWRQRGRHSEDLTMTRIDPELPWNINNCVVMTRREQISRQNTRNMESRY